MEIKIDIEKYHNAYLDYIKTLELPTTFKNQFANLLSSKDLGERKRIWNDLKINITDIPNVHKIANPFYLGYGTPSPKSKILFVGKELGFNILANPALLLHESINNLLQWEKVNEGAEKELDFNPVFPATDFLDSIKSNSGHTWRYYSKIIAAYLGRRVKEDGKSFAIASELKDSFFNHCFLTEYHFLPAPKDQKEENEQLRTNFLERDSFFKSFPIVIMSAKAYVDEDKVEEWFECTRKEEEYIKAKNDKNDIQIFRNDKQLIFRVSQLSGGNTWSNELMQKVGLKIKEHLD